MAVLAEGSRTRRLTSSDSSTEDPVLSPGLGSMHVWGAHGDRQAHTC